MDFSELNKAAQPQLQLKMVDLPVNKNIRIDALKFVDTKYGKTAVIEFNGNEYIYLSKRLSEYLLQPPQKEYSLMLERIRWRKMFFKYLGEDKGIAFFESTGDEVDCIFS